MAKVYLSSPFGQAFLSQKELENLLGDEQFVLCSHDDNYRISVQSLRREIQGAKGLFYYQFVRESIQALTYNKVITRVQPEDCTDVLVLLPEVPFYFVLYGNFKLHFVSSSN